LKAAVSQAKNKPAYVALLRGVNVGGKNKLPMKDLCAIFTRLGCTDVRSYIQSGNVIFRAEKGVLKSISESVTAEIAKRFGFQTTVILRSREELGDALANNPYLKRGADEKAVHLMFLGAAPGGENIRSLDPDRSPPDEFHVRNRDVYLYLRNGAAKTKLTNAWFDSRLKTVSTGRNWRTVMTLYDLTAPE
jgi:uncharacterized protein (DUF1697 family)